MDASRTREIAVPNDGHKVHEIIQECSTVWDDGSIDELILKVSLKHATRAVSLSEILQRRFADMVVENQITNVFVGYAGVDRRKQALLVIRATRQK